ncbi:uncharacterized protein LOC135212217 [Macrobrachium nipponense]|uniref:uncharacterized protein LOC135212217 n=1 Tax=Macrobrachium nipponense TaxID=159736 RepID=UPI0030C81912
MEISHPKMDDFVFISLLAGFVDQPSHRDFPCPELLKDFHRKSVVDAIVNLKEENAALQVQLQGKGWQTSCWQFQIGRHPEFSRQLDRQVDENLKLNEKVVSLGNENRRLKREIEDLKWQLQKTPVGISGGRPRDAVNLDIGNNKLCNKIQEYAQQVDDLMRKIEEKERLDISALKHQVTLLNVKTEELENTNTQLIEAIDLQVVITEVRTEVEKLREEHRRLMGSRDRHTAERDRLAEKVNDYEKQIAELKMKLEEGKQETTAKRSQVSALNDELQRMVKTRNELHDQVASLQEKVMDKDRKVRELKEENKRVKNSAEKEIQNLEDRVEDLSNEIEYLRKVNELGCNKEINNLRDQIIRLEMDNKILNDMKMDKVKENINLEGEMEEKNNVITRLRNRLDDLRHERKDRRNVGHRNAGGEEELHVHATI